MAMLMLSASGSLLLTVCSEAPTPVARETATPPVWPALTLPVPQDQAMVQAISELMNKMTLEQKIAQMIQPEIRDITVEDMRKYGFGSYLNGGGAFPNDNKYATPADWIALAEAMYQESIDASVDGVAIPTMWGTDAVHGHNNVIGATIFPHNIGLGAANNPAIFPIALVSGIQAGRGVRQGRAILSRFGNNLQGTIRDKSIFSAVGITLFFLITAAATVYFKSPFTLVNAGTVEFVTPYQLPITNWYSWIDRGKVGVGFYIPATTAQPCCQ